MTTDFSSGIVPPFYRELYEICSINDDPIRKEVFQCMLSLCKLSSTQLTTIQNLLKYDQEPITRTLFYKTLALIANAQQGKEITDKIFDQYEGKEYPTPDLGDISQIRKLKLKLNVKNAGFNYADIVQLDTIDIQLVPEKKGLFLKYSEYTVTSKRFQSRVTRRYNDFVALQELLLNRFPYRLVPSLPPKKIVSDAHFLESRRRGLHRWLTLICRHPTISQDSLISFFLTDQGPDVQHRIRDIFRRAPDEFMTSDIAATARTLLPPDGSQIGTSREQVRLLVQVIGKLKQLTEKNVERQNSYARDSEELVEQLKTLSTSQIGHGQNVVENWSRIQEGFALISRDLRPLSIRIDLHADNEQINVCERLSLLLDILVTHKELCERLEKGLSNDHQAALSKMLTLKKKKIQGVIRGTDTESVEQLEAKMLAQESVISNIELRSDFSFYCIYKETQLVYAYLETMSTILESLTELKIRSYSELLSIWKQVEPSIKQCLSKDNINGDQ